jgi:MFS family permease
MDNIKEKIGNYRWVIVGLLLFSTTFNYLDRQVISYLKPYFCSVEGFGWTNTQFSILTSFFTGFYGLMTIIAGFVIDKIGTKLGLALSLIVWSVFGIVNAFVGAVLWLHIMVRSFFGVGEAGNFPASIKTVAEWFPKKERALATSIFNSGSNLGAMIASLFVPWCMLFFGNQLGWKMAFILTGAIGFVWLIFWFWLYDSPSKSKRLSKAEFDYIHSDEDEKAAAAADVKSGNSGTGVSYGNLFSFKGRTAVPTFWGTFILINIICVFLIEVMMMMVDKTQPLGTAPKIFIGCVGLLYAWLILALQSRRLHDFGKSSSFLLINFIPGLGTLIALIYAGTAKGTSEPNQYGEISVPSILSYKQTWAFFAGKFFTDGIWWVYLFWLPDYLISQFGMTLHQVVWPTFCVYFVAIVGSVFGGSIPLMLINRGMKVYNARMTAMVLIAIVPLIVMTTQYFGNVERFGSAAMYLAVTVIAIAAAAHQAWSANLFTTVSDMFPKKAVGSVTGIGAMAGGLGGVLILMLTGVLRDAFLGNSQKAFMILFVICGLAYLVAWTIMKLLVPKHKPITL